MIQGGIMKNQDKSEEGKRTEQRLSKNKTGNKRKGSGVKKELVIEEKV